MSWKTTLTQMTSCSLLLVSSFGFANQAADGVAPEESTGLENKTLTTAKKWMVTAANPIATQAGADILAAGGNAIDAMVTVQLILGLVEPQSSGIGGGAFLVYWDAKGNRLTTVDGRETAPLAATPTLFQDEQGKPLKFYDAVVGGRSVGTPGTVKLLWDTHQQHGKLSWKQVVQPAIDLARKGFAISPRLAGLIAKDKERLSRFDSTKAYFFNADGTPKTEGTILKNPQYADTLAQIANNGANAFYSGNIAKDIVETVQSAPGNPGVLGLQDFANYRTKERVPVCAPYQSYDICGMGTPKLWRINRGANPLYH